MTRSNTRSPTTTEASTPPPDQLQLPDGRLVPSDLPEFLGRQDAVAWCRTAGMLDTRALLSADPTLLVKTSGVAGQRAKILAHEVRQRWQVEIGCLADPAPEVETRDRSPPRIPQRMQVPRGSDHDPPPSPQLALEAAALAANIRGAELARLLDHATPLNQPGETLRIRLAPAAHDLGPRLQAGVVPVVVET